MVFGIVADDLTGAADVVAPFADRGLSALVGLDTDTELEAEVCVWNTDTRDCTDAQEVIRRSECAIERLRQRESTYFYKKIDSTLRGWLRLELEVWRKAFPERVLLFCPAFPANGRTVQDGNLFVSGVRWQYTPFAPAGETRGIAELLDGLGGDTVLCTATTEEDLEGWAERYLESPERYFPVGSAGLSRAIARQLRPTQAPPTDLLSPFLSQAVLVLVGSRHPVSRKQGEWLLQRLGGTPVVWGGSALGQVAQEVIHRFDRGERCVVLTTPETPLNLSVSEGVGRIAAEVLRSVPHLQGVFATGGDTAYHLAKALNVRKMAVLGELEPGLVRGTLLSEQGREWAVVTKAGGFGTPETLCRLLSEEKQI